ncbi:XRE family transcriptional regulator [Nocardia sp. NPDC005978]|uniref:XRE family transcriptional regulator n=1 Tax=Nocardia sp. NPDC005978 TaxID=3156725 RepID=UPI0033ADED64
MVDEAEPGDALKNQLARLLDDRIRALGISGAGAGRIVGATKVEISNARHMRFHRIGTDRLAEWLDRLGVDVELSATYREVDLSKAERPARGQSVPQ